MDLFEAFAAGLIVGIIVSLWGYLIALLIRIEIARASDGVLPSSTPPAIGGGAPAGSSPVTLSPISGTAPPGSFSSTSLHAPEQRLHRSRRAGPPWL